LADRLTLSIRGIDPVALLGLADRNLNLIQRHFKAQIVVRGDQIRVRGEPEEVKQLRGLFSELIRLVKKGEALTPLRIEALLNNAVSIRPCGSELVIRTPRIAVQPKSPHQAEYLRAMVEFDLVVGIGPAGTGKTYLAVAQAVDALMSGRVARIVLTRPAVEAGESLGFLPGNYKEKVNPYLRPLYDALYEMVPAERVRRLIDNEVIEVAPLAFMRGRTLSDAYLILDEAQNTTLLQMKMFLTRLGWNSKAIVTGDITQIDLASRSASGLVEAKQILKDIRGIKFVYFDQTDVVRPPLVSEIIRAYELKGEG
jgi:phosphate starvation-inducible PhoH-like protein